MAAAALNAFRRFWRPQPSDRPDQNRRLRRFEFLEPRQMLHGGGDPEYDPNTNFHIHYQLDLFVNGTQQLIPTGVGNNLGANSGKIHTHDMTGLIHVHPGARSTFVTVAEFFDAWKNDTAIGNQNATFSSTNLLGNMANATHTVRMYVNGELNTDFQNYEFHDGDRVVVSYEPISTPVGSPMLEPISNQTVLVGSPLFLALDGFDPQGHNLTFSVTSSNPNVIQPTVLSGNRSMRITVPNFGEMEFQLFDNFAPRATNAIANLVNADFYNGLTFHRIIDNFMIQGGSHNGSGGANPNVPDFDDQFHFDLQHVSSGLLSMAKSLDDTNDTQFFITDAAARHLDFNHSIFGRLTDGEEVRNAINSVATNSSNQPLTPVTISDVQLITDNENGVLMLKAAPGATSGSSTITVTVTDSEGKTFVRTFTATLAADSSNGSPFLSDIAPVQGVTNQPVQIQLVGNDVEGDAIFYQATKIGSVNYTVSVNSSTGLVTVTPPAGFVGSFQVEVSAKAASQQNTPDSGQQITDVQKVTVNIGGGTPTGIDLQPGADTGISNTDNVTNAATLSFSVSGLVTGATVKVYDGSSVVAQGTASSATQTFTVNTSSLSQGVHQFSATQTITGESESAHTANLAVTFDTTAPAAFTSTPPTTATAGTPLTYDAQHPEEGTTNFRYTLVTAPTGVTINPTTGQLAWNPAQSQVGAHNFSISATDAAGNAATQPVSITVAAPVPKLAEIALSVINTSGQTLTNLNLNQDFFLVAQVRDLRSTPDGIFSFFSDVTFNSSLANVTGAIQFGSQYPSANTGSASAGLLDEVGGVSGSVSPIGGGFKELFRVPLRATAAGALTFTADPPDSENSEILLYTLNDLLNANQVTFGSTTVNVALNFTANNDTATVNEDSSNTTINVLNNDTIQSGSGAVLTIASTGATSSGGTVSIAPGANSLRYTPAANFFGTETFTYTVQNQSGATATATVTVTVNNVNDPPTAANDSFTVFQNSSNNNLTVLANDSANPDANETLTITGVGAGSQQGTITIAPGGGSLRYTPKANFTGSETFTYTISDGHGGTRQATVTMTVNAPGPVATADTATVQEDTSSATTINVLANDVPEVGGSQTLTVQSVGTPSNGGTVTVGTAGANVLYTPAANFQGTETFTYTLSDGTKTSTGTVTVTVSNTNDAPTATNDTLDAFKNTTTTLNVLANDVSAPDPTEAFTITAITQGAHGTVAISQDGTRVTYTPATDYTGPDTFTYTMRDPGGLTSTATVNLTVQNFLPSTLGGTVFLDADQDGIKDAGESPIFAALFTLNGTDSNGTPVTRTTTSAADGTYAFANLAPGNYTIQQTQPALLLDGSESTGGLSGATVSGNDKLTIALQQGTTATSLNFGELGKPRQLTRMQEFFASNLRNNLLTAIPFTAPTTSNPNFPALASPAWQTPRGTQWNGFSDFKFAVSNNNQQLRIEAKNPQSQTVQATVSLSDTSKVLNLGTQSGHRMFRLFGNPSTYNFQPVQQQAQAEGEADDSAVDAALAAIFDPSDEQMLATLAAAQEADEAAVDEAMAEGENWLAV